MHLLCSLCLAAVLGSEPSTRPADPATRRALPNEFFAMDTSTRDDSQQSIESQVQMAKRLGFDGYGPAYSDKLPEILKAVDAAHLKLSAVYVSIIIDADGPKFDPTFRQNVALLRGRKTIVWAVVRSAKRAPASEAMDQVAAAAIRDLADAADSAGLRVALYPHTWDYVESIRDALRLIKVVDRKNVGLSFNLCHALRVDGYQNIEPLLKQARPHLIVVSINGADREDPAFKDFSRYIQPLGEGDFDVYSLMRFLRKLGFDGPVGLQGYGLKGSVEEHLTKAIKTWREYSLRLEKE